jgi:hypothetical protein
MEEREASNVLPLAMGHWLVHRLPNYLPRLGWKNGPLQLLNIGFVKSRWDHSTEVPHLWPPLCFTSHWRDKVREAEAQGFHKAVLVWSLLQSLDAS